MQEIGSYIIAGLNVIIDVVTMLLVLASLPILIRAVYTMVQSKAPRWDNLLFIPTAFLLFALGLQLLPPLFMKSARIGLSDSRDEANLLREELKSWLPEVTPQPPDEPVQANNPADSTPAAVEPTITLIPPISATILVDGEPVDTAVLMATATPYPTATPIPPTPTSTPLPVCWGAREYWAPNCVLPTPEK